MGGVPVLKTLSWGWPKNIFWAFSLQLDGVLVCVSALVLKWRFLNCLLLTWKPRCEALQHIKALKASITRHFTSFEENLDLWPKQRHLWHRFQKQIRQIAQSRLVSTNKSLHLNSESVLFWCSWWVSTNADRLIR